MTLNARASTAAPYLLSMLGITIYPRCRYRTKDWWRLLHQTVGVVTALVFALARLYRVLLFDAMCYAFDVAARLLYCRTSSHCADLLLIELVAFSVRLEFDIHGT
jgi:hypothetical protein